MRSVPSSAALNWFYSASPIANAVLAVRLAILLLDGTVRGPLIVAAPLLVGCSHRSTSTCSRPPKPTDAVLGELFESVGEYGMNKFLLGNMATPIDVGNGRSLYTDSFVIAAMNKLFPDAELKFEQLYDYQRLPTQGQLKWQIDGEVVAVSMAI